MKKFSFNIFTLFAIAICFPLQALALGSTIHYGGYVLLTIPCTCTPGTFLATYAPLHIEGIPAPIFGTLITSSTVQRWAYQQFVYPPIPTTWQLGEMNLGGECLIGVEPDCLPVIAYGTVKKTGASFPGFSPVAF